MQVMSLDLLLITECVEATCARVDKVRLFRGVRQEGVQTKVIIIRQSDNARVIFVGGGDEANKHFANPSPSRTSRTVYFRATWSLSGCPTQLN